MFKNKQTIDQNEINLQSPNLETQLLKKAFSYPGRQISTQFKAFSQVSRDSKDY